MSDWLLNLPVVWMAVVILGTTYAFAAGLYALITAIAPTPLVEALQVALAINPQNQGQAAAQREIVGSLQTALDARRQRIILSRSSVNWVKWAALLIQASLTLVTIAMVHSDNRVANR